MKARRVFHENKVAENGTLDLKLAAAALAEFCADDLGMTGEEQKAFVGAVTAAL